MTKCHHCGKETALPFRCKYCGNLFCEDCRLPPKHNCSGIDLWFRRASPSNLKREDEYIPVRFEPDMSRKTSRGPVKKRGKSRKIKLGYKKPKRKSGKLRILLLLMFIALLGIGGYYSNNLPIKVDDLDRILPNATQTEVVENVKEELSKAKKSVNQTLQEVIRTPSREEITNETIHAVLEYLNKERVKRGLPAVELISTGIAQFRAEDMIKRNYFGHYDPEGYPPFYYYTKKGGLYAMEENCGEYRIVGGLLDQTDVADYALKSVKSMIYDDALSNWGHRDSLLDPSNNYIDIGVAWDSNRMVLVLHMTKKYVEWTKVPKVDNMVFSASGKLNQDVKFEGVMIYYHPPPREEFNKRHSYDIGDPIAGVVPGRAYYEDIETWRPLKWTLAGQKFDISFKIRPIKGPGFYTVVIWAENKSGLKHPFDPERDDYWTILEYTVFVQP
ncbi:AN1-type zinc finger domain-containing protein [Geoglobus acetivorans]|uniref:AN1-type domain-containing protein n=1 Tax=Geoglobus acetivorans TaxID=565033 RepID=A0ABZ3H4V1_GEOAI|nr:hypothetical protein [Geoglobus acetivorans]